MDVGKGREQERKLCQIPRSRFFFLLVFICSVLGKARENLALIKDQRIAKFASFSGNVQIACR